MRSVSPVAPAILVGLSCLALSSPVRAQVFFGRDLNPDPSLPLSARPNADAARAAFLASVSGTIGTETFEGFPDGAQPASLTFGSATATVTGVRQVYDIPPGTTNTGGFPISGTKLLIQFDAAGGSSTFTLSFSSPITAFGFYGIDVEEASELTLSFLLQDGITTVNEAIPGAPAAANNGSVFYFGFSDPTRPFTSVSFSNTDSGDGFGYDDITIGPVASSSAPEPSSGLIVLGILLLSGTMRKIYCRGGRHLSGINR